MINVFNVENKKTLLAWTLVLGVLIAISFYAGNVLNRNNDYEQNIAPKGNHVLKVGNISINVDIVDTPALRERGLSGRKTLPVDQGMYFVFDRPGIYPFWMKEMNFPIDIIWIGENMMVADITESALPSSFPQIFTSKTPVSYVLEVQSGFAKRHGVKIGNKIVLLDSN